MLNSIKSNWSLWLGIALPIVLILFVAVSIYLPRLWTAPPQYNFLYTDNNYVYPGGGYYRVEDNHLSVVTPAPTPLYPGEVKPIKLDFDARLYIYDVKQEKSQEISFAQAQRLNLNSEVVSPDGFSITEGGNGGFFPFDGGYNYERYLKKGSYTKKLNLLTSQNYYNFRFLGWVKQ